MSARKRDVAPEVLGEAKVRRKRKRRASDVPAGCRMVLSEAMKAGVGKSEAMRRFWSCRKSKSTSTEERAEA